MQQLASTNDVPSGNDQREDMEREYRGPSMVSGSETPVEKEQLWRPSASS